jgi:hypothetical protein
MDAASRTNLPRFSFLGKAVPLPLYVDRAHFMCLGHRVPKVAGFSVIKTYHGLGSNARPERFTRPPHRAAAVAPRLDRKMSAKRFLAMATSAI